MAHFAEIDSTTNTVVRVIVVDNNELLDATGIEREYLGQKFCKKLLNGGTWVQTSYNCNFRKNFAGVGYTYDSARDAFIPPKPYSSWVLDENTCNWISPVPYPTDGKIYSWNEQNMSWIEVT